MVNPFRRFFGGLGIGTLIAIPFVNIDKHPFLAPLVKDSMVVPLAPSDVIIGLGLLGLCFAWWGVRESVRAPSGSVRHTVVEEFRQRRRLQRSQPLRNKGFRRSRLF